MRRALVLGAVAAGILAAVVPAVAFFSQTRTLGANTFSTATLQPPTGLGATTACAGTKTAKITLDWTATTSTFAEGYSVYRSTANGGPYAEVASVTGRNTTTYTDSPLDTKTTYYYVLQSTAGDWTSVNSNQAQATTPHPCR